MLSLSQGNVIRIYFEVYMLSRNKANSPAKWFQDMQYIDTKPFCSPRGPARSTRHGRSTGRLRVPLRKQRVPATWGEKEGARTFGIGQRFYRRGFLVGGKIPDRPLASSNGSLVHFWKKSKISDFALGL